MSNEFPLRYVIDDETSPEVGLEYLISSGLVGFCVPTEYGGLDVGVDQGNVRLLKNSRR